MTVEDIVIGDSVLIKKGTRSSNLDETTIFGKDIVGTVVIVGKGVVTIDIPDYPMLRTYGLGDVIKLVQEYRE